MTARRWGNTGSLLGNLIPLAIGFAISPVPVIAVILMLSSEGALANAVLFDIGWLSSIIATSAVFLLCFGSRTISENEATGTAGAALRAALGILLLLLAGRRFIQRRKAIPQKQPRLLQSIESVGAAAALGIGAATVVLNPKNLVLLLSALSQVIQTGASTGTNVVALAIFTLVGSIGVLLPLAIYVIFREKASAILGSWNAWLTAHNSTVMMYLLLVLGILLVVKGILGLV